MAWTAPRTYSVGEVQTAAIFNVHIRDNLKYLKGLSGSVSIEDALMIGSSSAPSYQAQVTISDSTATRTGAIGAEAAIENTSAGGIRSAGVRFRVADTGATIRSAARVLGSFAAATFSDSQLVLQTASAAETFRDVMTLRGTNVGIGTTAPASTFHALNTTTSGGMLFLSATAVAGGLQTLAVAGTVTVSAAFWLYDRNNTGGGLFPISGNALALGGTFTIVNTDTVTVTLTAGGAITVQRTSGTNGTHEIQMLVLYK